MDSYNRLSNESMMSNEISLQRYPSPAEAAYPSSYPPPSEGYLKLNHTRSDPSSTQYSPRPNAPQQYPARMGEPPHRTQSSDGPFSSLPRGGLSRSPPCNVDEMDYLEPTSTIERRQKRGSAGRMPLHDSGVDIQDVPLSVNGSPSIHTNNNNNSAPNMFNYPHTKNTRPESVAVKGHLYEELPTAFGRDKQPASYPIPAVPTAQGHVSPSTANVPVPNRPTFRKRQNPLYEESDPEEESSKKGGIQWFQCPCLCVMITSVLLAITLLLVVLLLVGIFDEEPVKITDPSTGAIIGNDDVTEELRLANNRISQLEQQYESLYNLMLVLQNNQSSMDATVSGHTQQISSLSEEITAVESSLTTQIQALDASVQSRLEGVNVVTGAPGTAGPEGPAGAAGSVDMSACRYRNPTVGASDSSSYTDTAWIPTSEQDAQDWVITGLECSVENGNNTYLIRDDQLSYTRFKCRCHGSLGLAADRYCLLHVWDCPRDL